MSTNNKSFDKLAYTEKVMNMTDARFLSEASTHRFEKRRTPVSTWIAAACFALIFAAAAILLIKPMGERPIDITQPTEGPTEDITAPMSEESARGIIASLIVYHNGQFTRSAQLGNLKLSPSVAADLEKRQRCIDEAEARLGKNFSKASVTGSTTFRSFTPNGKNMTVSFTQLTKLVTGDAASDLIVITAEHTAEIAPDGTILSDFFSEDAIGFTNIPIEPAPSQAPIPYNREEYDTLLAFFELADENGVKNGEKCFENYDPTKVDFWGGESAQYGGLPCFEWNEEGDLVALRFACDSEKSIKLVGAFMLDGFESLTKLSSPAFMVNEVHTSAFVFDSVKITNCPKLGGAGTFEAIGDVELNGWLGLSQLVSSSRCRFEGRDALSHPMLAELTAEGSGRVELLSHADEHYYPVYINAIPDDGHSFLGWYDADGKLFSTEDRVEISDEAIGGCEGEFIYTARFEPVQSVLKTDPWYLEKAWEYAELANREYGFRFDRDEWSVSEYLNAISFIYGSSEDFLGSQLSVHFIEGKKEVDCAEIWNDVPSDAPVDYASLSEEERKRLHNESMLVNSYTVTPHDMENAGYTLDGTDLDYVKIAEYCSRINVERLTGCSENNYELCREVDIGSVFMLGTSSGNGHVYCNAAYYFRPAYPLSFLSKSIDIGCIMMPPDDAEHPGWLTYSLMSIVHITKTANGWECSTGFPSEPAIAINTPLVANPRYLEKAWEYAELANREYGFSFVKYVWEPRDNAIVFSASKPGMHNRQTLYVFFHEVNGEEIIEPVLMGDSSDIPAGYSELGEAEREAIDKEIANLPEYHVTPQDMLQAGYTLDGTEQDYIKIAEYCGRRYAAMFTVCSEINPQFCREAEAVDARRNEWMLDSTGPIYCLVSYYFRPAYPLCFTDRHGDIGCDINELDDADHPGWITFGGDVLITPTDNGWNCKIAFISGY